MITSVTIYTGISALWNGSSSRITVPAAIAMKAPRLPNGSLDCFPHSGRISAAREDENIVFTCVLPKEAKF